MEQRGQLAASKMIESLTGWWELAGVDAAVGELPVDWLAIDTEVQAVESSVLAPARTSRLLPAAPAKPAARWPADIETLKAMVASGASLPGNGFGTSFVAPVGAAPSDVMVISDLPDQDELAAGTIGSGATGALLKRMLAAIGIDVTDCYWTALATTIPPTGEIPENALNELTAFVRHQIGMIKPQSLILLGSAACKALLGEEPMKARQSLGNFNHDGSTMAVLTTFHPRTLIARSAMKAQAWKDLQMFAKRADL